MDPFSFDITPSSALTEVFDANTLFQTGAPNSRGSSIDQYLDNSNKLTKIYTNSPFREALTPELGAVLLLGHVSAVESYMRGIIRGLVYIDEHAGNLAAPKQLSYFAALNHEPRLMPEALLESISFSGAQNISNALKEFCGITGMGNGNIPNDLKPVFKKFNDICQLRHCCVHRFGLLGAGNAHKLKVEKNLIEMPLALTIDALEDISSILEKLVLSINSYIYKDVLYRSFTKSNSIASEDLERQYQKEWARNPAEDEQRFGEYYYLFAVTSFMPASPNLQDSYVEFQEWMNKTLENISRAKASTSKSRQQPPSLAPSPSAHVPFRSPTTQPATTLETQDIYERGIFGWLKRLFANN